jgi:hypothetical protein
MGDIGKRAPLSSPPTRGSNRRADHWEIAHE